MKINEKTLVTLLVPVYNSPDLFCTLESIRCQTYRPIQCILVDDASEVYEENRIRRFFSETGDDFELILMRNEKNLGTVRTMNRGLAAAEGKYCFVLAGDDAFFDNNVLTDWVDAFERTNFDVLTARRAVCDHEMQKVLEILPPEKVIHEINRLSSAELYEYLAKENQISGACTAWRTATLSRLQFFDEHFRLLDDYPNYLRLLRSGGKIGFFDRVVIRYRSGGTSAEEKPFSADYEKDYTEIFRWEIIPHTHKPLIMKMRFCRFQHRIRFDRWYNNKVNSPTITQRHRELLRVCYYIYHPVRLTRRIKKKNPTMK